MDLVQPGRTSMNDRSMHDLDRRICVAPMMDLTDRHCRYFLRGFAADALLYTEMITAQAILRGDRERLLRFDPDEHPVALQLGGSDPHHLAAAARAGEQAGYDEVNLNCGCPSDKVADGAFGACLMLAPARVAACVAEMRSAVALPVTVKMRIGVVRREAASNAADSVQSATARFDEDDFEALAAFVTAVRDAGCAAVIVHARKAVLGGLSPRENREIPPLRYDVVKRLKAAFPSLPVVVNGGFQEPAAVREALGWCEGVMIGREAYQRPCLLADLQQVLRPDAVPAPSRGELLERMARYAEREVGAGGRLSGITRHMLGLYTGQPGAREYRRLLSEGARAPGAGPELLHQAFAALRDRESGPARSHRREEDMRL
jgi:tRNA-dihydrouridine synthase A